MEFQVENGIVYTVTPVSKIYYGMQYNISLSYDATSNAITATVADYTGAVQTTWADAITYTLNGTAGSVTPANGVATIPVNDTIAGQVTVQTTVAGVGNGTLTFTPNNLATTQANQITALTQGLESTLNGGFTAKTLVGGAASPHTYPTDASAQSNFSGAINAFIANPNKTSVTVQTLDAGWVSHTKAEFYGVYSDGDDWKEAQYAQYNQLEAQVKAQTSIPATPVTWTPASY